MRLAIVSDTHMPRGTRALPEACVEQLEQADAILHAGDFFALEVLEQLESYGVPVHGVWGNVDRLDVRARLPERTVVEADGARIGMVHDPGPGRGRLQRLRQQFPDADAVVFGHTHMPQHGQDGRFQIFNPGSPTERRRAPSKTMGLATIRNGRVTFDLLAVG